MNGVDNTAWNPYFANVYVIACNEEWFEENGVEYPKTWDDLLDPAYEGAITLPHPSTSGVGLFALNFMLQSRGEEEGWKFFTDLGNNVRQYSKGSSAAMMAVSLGEAALTVTGPQETLSAQNEGYPVHMDILDDLNGYSFSGMSLIKGGPADETANAKLFIDWMLSEEGQGYVAEAYRSPVNSNVESAEGMPVISELNLFTIDPIVAAENKEANIQTFIDRVNPLLSRTAAYSDKRFFMGGWQMDTFCVCQPPLLCPDPGRTGRKLCESTEGMRSICVCFCGSRFCC